MNAFIPKKYLAFTILCECISRIALLFAIAQIPFFAEKSFSNELDFSDLSFFLIATFMFAAFHFISQKLSLKLGGEAKKRLRAYFQNEFLNALPIQDRAQKGMPMQELSLHYIKTADLMEPWYSRFLPSLWIAIIVPCTILFAMFYIDKFTFIVLLFTGLILPLFLFLIGKFAKKKSEKQWQSFSKLRAFFLESLQGYKTIKIFKKFKERESNLEAAESEFGKKTLAVLRTAFLSAFVQELAGSLSIALIAVSLALRLMSCSAEFNIAFLALLITPEFYRPIRQFGTAFHAAINAKTAWASTQVSVRKAENNSKSSILDSQLILQTKDEKIIISPKNPLCIVGESGSGKTRLVLEMLGHIEPQNKETKLLYSGDKNNIAWLPQNPVWFKGTLLDNLCPIEKQSFSRIRDVLEKVNLGHFMKRLNEPVQEYANNFSSGEKRRLAIARVVLLSRPIWILDEPFAGLDNANVQIVEEFLKNESEIASILCISHHEGTIKYHRHVLACLPLLFLSLPFLL